MNGLPSGINGGCPEDQSRDTMMASNSVQGQPMWRQISGEFGGEEYGKEEERMREL